MRGIVEVPVKIPGGKIVGKVLVDTAGRVKIQTDEWLGPEDLKAISAHIQESLTIMSHHQFARKPAPPRRRWGIF